MSMANRLTPDALANAIRGDFEAFSLVQQAPHVDIQESRKHLADLTVTRLVLRAVLIALEHHRVPPCQVQQWALFVRRGYVSDPAGGPAKPVDIACEAAHKEQIVEVVSRLDEIGDMIGREISNGEVTDMIRHLSD